jgi:beta-galactosidase
MKRTLALILAAASIGRGGLPSARAEAVAPVPATENAQPFDGGWQFSRGDFGGAQLAAFDDSGWRTLDLPHDWSIEGPFDAANPAGGAGAFLPTGVGWYRKHFPLPAAAAGHRLFIEFDGVMANSDVWINGTHLGRRPFGYVGFRYELPARVLKFGGANVIAVRCNNADQPASRWYTGAGIYRHVRLYVLNPVHFEAGGIFVTTSGDAADRAVVQVRSTVVNQSDADREVVIGLSLVGMPPRSALYTPVAGGSGESARQKVPAHQSVTIKQEIVVLKPKRWNLDDPELYRASVSVIDARERDLAAPASLDQQTVVFGIRDAHFDADTGFWLNGRNLKLKGVCLHADGSAFGAAVPLDVWARRLRILQELGVNAIRTAHNPPAPEFLDLCDRMGFLVMDEMFDCWTVAKNIGDYHLYFEEWSKLDTRDTVRRDRNHPSIILYSAGNEIHDTPNAELSKRILAGLVEVFHENDPTRPVTQALLRPNFTHDYDDGLADLLDVVGTNYRDSELLAAHAAKPSRKIVGTENHHDREGWLAVRDHAAYSGQFLWAGIDYLGESPLWPLVSSRAGLIDRTGTPHPLAFERQSWWSTEPVVHLVRRVRPPAPSATDPGYNTPVAENYRLRPPELFADWTPAATAVHDEHVEVYSNCESVELFLNGRSLGSAPLPADAAPRTWTVAFAAGSLKAVASNHGRVVATDELQTAGPPAKILLSSNQDKIGTDWDSVATVTATVVDAQGVPVPGAGGLVHFALSGPGSLRLDSGNHSSHELFQASARQAYEGRCFALVKFDLAGRPATPLTLTVAADGLEGAALTVSPLAPSEPREEP